MGFTVYQTPDLNTNEKMIAFYKKELFASHIIQKAKQMKHYGTKWYRKSVSYDFPSSRRYQRMRAIVSNHYKTTRKRASIVAWMGKIG
ncbi:MAG: hypothetical protein NZL83_02725 [Candidatus Absconditabacterales bacterium]|nr:hypothetical protein [Candidatus Absconditabacterales bacterium]